MVHIGNANLNGPSPHNHSQTCYYFHAVQKGGKKTFSSQSQCWSNWVIKLHLKESRKNVKHGFVQAGVNLRKFVKMLRFLLYLSDKWLEVRHLEYDQITYFT